MAIFQLFLIFGILMCMHIEGFVPRTIVGVKISSKSLPPVTKQADLFRKPSTYGQSITRRQNLVLRDILGLSPTEIAVALFVGLLIFGPETLKSLSKDVGKAAAELKDLPKVFKEGMEEGSESAQVMRMKEMAAEKRKKRDAKLAAAEKTNGEDDASDDSE